MAQLTGEVANMTRASSQRGVGWGLGEKGGHPLHPPSRSVNEIAVNFFKV